MIKNPEKNEDLAEFLGACFGDGCLSVNEKKHDYALYFTGHLLDDELYMKNYLAKLIKKLFSIEPKIRNQKGLTLILYFRSKEIVLFLNKIGMQIGRKNNLIIPDWIKDNTEFMKSFIRGFADTDGCLTFKKRYSKIHYYPVISMSSMNKNLICDINSFLKLYGFVLGKVSKSTSRLECYDKTYTHYRMYIYGKENLEKWMKLIGFSNMKHKSKYVIWKKSSQYEPYSTTNNRINNITNRVSML